MMGMRIAAGAVAITMLVAPVSAQVPDVSPRAVVARAAESLTALKKSLEFVLADENAEQRVVNAEGRLVQSRRTSGDFFLSYVVADGGWLSVRDLAVVDDQPVQNRDDLRALLTQGSMLRIGRALADRNARFNIGPVMRNFNDPMLAAVLLDDRHRGRLRFQRRRVDVADGTAIAVLSFEERDRPTLIRGAGGEPIFTRGELHVDAATGQLRRSAITMKVGPTSASLTTTFALVERLNQWLPSQMDERYDHTSSKEQVSVLVTSTYTNYRRFEATGRIK